MEGEIVYEITTSPYPLAESPICRSTFLQTPCLQSCWSISHARKKNSYLSFNSFSKGERLEGEKCKKGLKQ